MNIFVSHTHDDGALAHALRDLIRDVFDEHVKLVYSSDSSQDGGVAAGENWLQWIANAVQGSDLTFVLLTPRSVRKPWILWESGAVAGVALADGTLGRLIPILYRMRPEDIPEPMRALHAVLGETQSGIRRVLQRLNSETTKYPSKVLDATTEKHAPIYLKAVAVALMDQPLLLDEAQIGEWINRLDKLRAERRSAEVGHLHYALNLATSGGGGPGLLDLRIHRRLGEMYLEGRQFGKAIEQLQLAVQLVPRDIYLLHQLGLAHLENNDTDSAAQVLKLLETLDEAIAATNPEIAGFKGRLFRQRWKEKGTRSDLRAARDAYAATLELKPDAYYLADNVGQLSLALGEKDRAVDAFRQATGIIERSGERSVWSLATLATAAIVLGTPVEPHLVAIRALGPSPREVDSILGGLERIQQGLGLPSESLAEWKRILTSSAL